MSIYSAATPKNLLLLMLIPLSGLLFSFKKKKKKVQQLKSGISYQVIVKGKGARSPKVDDMITMHIRAYVSDSMLFDSYRLNDNTPVPAQITKALFNGDIMELLQLMKEGDSVVARVPQDSLFRQEGMVPPFAKKGDPVIYQLKLVTVRTKEDHLKEEKERNISKIAEEASAIDKYIIDKQLKNVETTASGLRYIITKNGTGKKTSKGKDVSMNYTGMLLNGNKFDSNILPEFGHQEPFKFQLGTGRVIKGWDEGILLLNVGTKALLIIPSPLAYGANSPSPNIPANSIMLFEVEVLDTE
jgi:FKBP-type peptidyl-prolyl cis-trans isomerase FkpA